MIKMNVTWFLLLFKVAPRKLKSTHVTCITLGGLSYCESKVLCHWLIRCYQQRELRRL